MEYFVTLLFSFRLLPSDRNPPGFEVAFTGPFVLCNVVYCASYAMEDFSCGIAVRACVRVCVCVCVCM